jgi:hypothetical protein
MREGEEETSRRSRRFLPKNTQILMKFDRFLHSKTALLCISQAELGLFRSRQDSFGQPVTPGFIPAQGLWKRKRIIRQAAKYGGSAGGGTMPIY